MSGYCVQYGTYPDQGRYYYSLAMRAPDVAGRSPRRRKRGGNLRAAWRNSSQTCLARQWQRDDGTFIQIGRLLIDSGYLPEIVSNAIRKIGQTAIAMPSKGIGISAGNMPMGEYERRPGDQTGHYWRTTARGPRELRQVHFDSTIGRLSFTAGCPWLWAEGAATRSTATRTRTTNCWATISAPNIASRPRAGAGRFGSGSPSPASPTTTGSTAPSGPPLRHPCWGAVCQAVHRRQRPHGKPR